MNKEISAEQAQALMDVIADKCEQLDLEPQQILDGIARSLIGAMNAFDVKQLQVNIEGLGQCQVMLDDNG